MPLRSLYKEESSASHVAHSLLFTLLLMVVYIFTQDSRNTSNVSVVVEQIRHETKLYVTATLFSLFLVSMIIYSSLFILFSNWSLQR